MKNYPNHTPEQLLLTAIFGAHVLSQAVQKNGKNYQVRKIEDYPDILDVQDVQEILRIGKSLCYKIVKAMPYIKVGKSYRVSKKHLLKTYFNEVE